MRVDPGGQEQRFLLDRDLVTIGRDPDATIPLADGSVSRLHAYVRRIDADLVLCDGASTNGTWLNGVRLEPGHGHPLRAGDVVEVGQERLSVSQEPAGTFTRTGEMTYPLDDLRREGQALRGAEELHEVQRAVLRALSGSFERGAARLLRLVQELQQSELALLCCTGPGDQLVVVAADRSAACSAELQPGQFEEVARRALATHQGVLVRGYVPTDPEVALETRAQDPWSAAAIPIAEEGQGTRGALVVARSRRPRLAKRDLAALSIVARAVEIALAFPRLPEDALAR